ncbi:hypothetical protein LCGC14_1235890, partial [marine sediment metagenome]
MKRITLMVLVAAALASVGATAHGAGEIGFVEEFALSADRSVPLKQLIPGTEDYYYYHCLDYQNTGKLAEVEDLLKLWIKRYGHTARVKQIRNRQALLKYNRDPRGSLDFIKWRLGLKFNHQREVLGRKTSLPTSLDPKRISRATLSRLAFGRYSNLNGFEDSALEWLAARNLNDIRRRDLLRRLKRPDVADMAKLVVTDLKAKASRGFGSHPIHRQLLRAQLDECLKLKGDLLTNTNFINAYLTKLQPAPDEDWLDDPKVRQAHLERMWDFVSKLAPAHNSIKAHVLYHRLVFDRSQGVYDKGRFMTYVKLPRSVNYINPKYAATYDNRRWRANLNANYQSATMFPPIRTDEPLVRSYLMHFFVKENSYQPYAAYIRDTYLKPVFAETKIVNGIGDMEQWYSLLSPSATKALKERVDLDFAFTNKAVFGPDDKVALDLHVKNVKKLLVRVFRINTLNYYRDKGRELGSDINLDGLVTDAEKVHNYKEPALRRVRRSFRLPDLKARGVYVVEFIGNGKSSRVLVRKGKLRYTSRTSTAGHVITVLDESNRKLPEAKAYLGGKMYEPDEDGVITVPFSNKPARVPIVLINGDFASLSYLDHQSENYSLQAGIHVDREALLTRKKARVIVRPALFVNAAPVTLSVLKDVKLLITSTDHDGVNTTKPVRDFKLFEDRQSSFEFTVPERLSRISFTLTARVEVLSQSKKQTLSSSASFSLNQIDKTEKVEDLHLLRVEGKYVLDVLGRTGEAKADRPVQLALKHRDFRTSAKATLQTDADGRVGLGELTDIVWITARGPEGTSHKWLLVMDEHTQRSNVHGRAGQAIYIPYMGSSDKADRAELSLLEVRRGTYVKDWFSALRVKGGFVVVDDLPEGDYQLYLKRSGTTVTLRLTAGDVREGYVMGRKRHLQVRNAKPLQIVSVAADRRTIKVRLANATKFTRVYVVATRYMPEYSIYSNLGRIGLPGAEVIQLARVPSIYQAGRNIGDEYRYILDRKYVQKFPGNMLTRPGLLLNPWAIRKTEAARQLAAAGQRWARKALAPQEGRSKWSGRGVRAKPAGNFANLDFLADGSVVMVNLTPDRNGVVTIDRKDLGAHQQLHVVAVDPGNTAYRELSLPEVDPKYKDLRLIRGLDPAGKFAEKKQVTVVRKGEKFVLADVTSSKFEVYDSLAKVHKLYATLSGNATLREFNFILRWPEMEEAKKREKYSKYACHELTFFIYKKDPEFFKKVVLPYLANKKDKTYMDLWLLSMDVSGQVKPWSHGQLNTVEKILLGQRLAGERAATARYVKDLRDLIPPNVERFNRLFDTALKAGALETADEYGMA